MPRWPKEEKELPEIDLSKKSGDTFNLPNIEETKVNGNPPDWVDMLHSRIDSLVLESAEYRRMIEPLILPLLRVQTEQDHITPVTKRRSEDEVRRALKTLASGTRPRDDESEQVLLDCMNEMFHLRSIVYNMMQSSQALYQDGLNALRKMTERQ